MQAFENLAVLTDLGSNNETLLFMVHLPHKKPHLFFILASLTVHRFSKHSFAQIRENQPSAVLCANAAFKPTA